MSTTRCSPQPQPRQHQQHETTTTTATTSTTEMLDNQKTNIIVNPSWFWRNDYQLFRLQLTVQAV